MTRQTTINLIVLSILSSSTFMSAFSSADPITCRLTPYYDSEYTCYEDSILCPVISGQPTLPCNGSCYSPDMYVCNDNSLSILAETNRPFTLLTQSSNPDFNNMTVHACNNMFGVGDKAETCVYCYNAPPLYDCATFANNTVLEAGGKMGAAVPGSQYWFVDPNTSALMFTEGGKANDISDVSIAGQNVTVYTDGYFAYDLSPRTWYACPAKAANGTIKADLWELYAPRTEISECYDVKLSMVSVDSTKEGAYTYV